MGNPELPNRSMAPVKPLGSCKAPNTSLIYPKDSVYTMQVFIPWAALQSRGACLGWSVLWFAWYVDQYNTHPPTPPPNRTAAPTCHIPGGFPTQYIQYPPGP